MKPKRIIFVAALLVMLTMLVFAKDGGSHPEFKRIVFRPEYPLLAIQGRVEGDVKLRCGVSSDGKVFVHEVLHGLPVLAQAAKNLASTNIVAPLLRSDTFDLTYTFKLESPGGARVPQLIYDAPDRFTVTAPEPVLNK